MKRDSLVDLVTAVVSIVATVYLSKPRPAPRAAFWWHLSNRARQVSLFAQDRYRDEIGGIG